jgi:hypothetical protein
MEKKEILNLISETIKGLKKNAKSSKNQYGEGYWLEEYHNKIEALRDLEIEINRLEK